MFIKFLTLFFFLERKMCMSYVFKIKTNKKNRIHWREIWRKKSAFREDIYIITEIYNSLATHFSSSPLQNL